MKTLVAIPCMDTVHTLFFKSVLGMRVRGEVDFSLGISSLIYDARNQLAHKAITEGFDRVLWLDSDMYFAPNLFELMSDRLDEGYEIISGLYFTRKDPVHPVIYDYCGLKDGRPTAEPYRNYPQGEPFEIAAHGFGGVMMTTRLLQDVANEYGLPFSPVAGFGEDLSFCMRVRELGVKMYCDPAIQLGHIAYIPITEQTYKESMK